ncbi:MAG: VOC family protein [Candidatus Limnocylindrales bacterium]
MFTDAFVNLYTHDIAASLRFYRDLFGFEERRATRR